MLSTCIIDLLVTVNNVKMLIVVQKYFNGEFVWPATEECLLFFVRNARHICLNLMKFEVPR